mmetsp:Transcript_58139/g.160973  ORF Transcript_58139/g.160973 Transcript_58139/m.160973 type:complete len:575 (+) Transcript_58139:1-1725(+)
MGIISIGVDYFQVLAIFGSTKVEWPETVTTIYSYLAAFNFDIGITAPECTFTISYASKWYIVTSVPILIFMGFLSFHIYKVCFKKFVKHRRGKQLNTHVHSLIGNGLYMFYFVYLYLLQTTLDVFNCSTVVSVDGVEDAGENGEGYMSSEPTEPCYVEGGVQMELVPYATILGLLYGCGYPLICFYVLILNRDNKRSAIEDQLVRAQQLSNSRENNPNCYEFRKRYGKLYYQFKPQYHYWGLVILARKFMFACAELLLRKNATFQLCAVSLVMFTAYVAQVRCKPFMSTAEMPKVCLQHIDDIEQMDATKARKIRENAPKKGLNVSASFNSLVSARLTSKQKEHKKINAQAAAEELLWNWNNVEGVLLISCVLVCTFGIMFEADYVDAGTSEHESLGLLVLLTILLSMVYYFIVVWSEIVVKIAPGLRCPDWINPAAKKRKMLAANKEGDTEEELTNRGSLEFAYNPMMGMASPNSEVVRESSLGGLMSLEEQVKLQDLVKTLKDEVQDLKKKNTAVASMQAHGGGKAAVIKKKKSGNFTNIGTGSAKARREEESIVKKKGAHVEEVFEAEDGL